MVHMAAPPSPEHTVIGDPHEWWLSTVARGNIFTDGSLLMGQDLVADLHELSIAQGLRCEKCLEVNLAPFNLFLAQSGMPPAWLSNTVDHSFVSPLIIPITCSIGKW